MTYGEVLRFWIKYITELHATKHNVPNNFGRNNNDDYYFDEGKYRFYVYYRFNGTVVEVCDQVDIERSSVFDFQLYLKDDSARIFDTLHFHTSWSFDYYNTEEELFQNSLIHDLKDLTLKDIKDLINLKSIL